MWNYWNLKNRVFQFFQYLRGLNKITKSSNFNKSRKVFRFFTEILSLPHRVLGWAGDNTNLLRRGKSKSKHCLQCFSITVTSITWHLSRDIYYAHSTICFFYIYDLHVFKQKIYSHQVLKHLDVPGIPVKDPLQNSW